MRKLSVLMVIFLIWSMGSVALAQGGMQEHMVFCGEMSEEDCALYKDLQTAPQIPDSATTATQVDLLR